MFIQSITISGFKSYRDATVAGPFSSSHNVVVGRNGSGKSNFFDAVRFLLSDTFAHLRGEERVALLHEGAGASVLSAYVEMVFDNADGRLPFDRDTVALRRMVGLQKDEYVLDRKNVSRTEVFNLLESAGFSRSNPYYIVQQGKVAALCAMSDKNRLDLLKEVAGTRVYDERRDESLKIMDETDGKREKISEVIDYIESRLAELDGEKDELKTFQLLDRDRRALEYTIYVKDLDAAKEALKTLSDTRGERKERGADAAARLQVVRAAVNSADGKLVGAKLALETATEERGELEEMRKTALATVAKLQVDVAEGNRAASAATETAQAAEAELETLNNIIEERAEELEPVQEEFDEAKGKERQLRSHKAGVDASVLALRVKSERGNQFRSAEERNRCLSKEVSEARAASLAAKKQRSKAESDIVRLEGACKTNRAKISQRLAEAKELEGKLAALGADLTELRAKRDNVHTKRHEKWRIDAECSGKIKAMSEGMKRLENAKRSAFGAQNYHAIQSVMQASAERPDTLGPSRVFGPLVDLINVSEKFTTAANVTAGNSLTHVVVDTDATAARLVKILQEKRNGRVTFIPLNRLSSGERTPLTATADALPLISKIQCDDRFLPAVRSIFGRTMVTRTVEIATKLSASNGIDCVTMDGDQVNKQGAMTGGYIDLSRGKIEAARELRQEQEELARLQPESVIARNEAADIDAELSRLLGELQQLEATHRSSTSRAQRVRSECEQFSRYLKADNENIPKAKERILSIDEAVAARDKRCTELESEMKVPLSVGLTGDEQQRLDELQEDRDDTGQSLAEIVTERTKVEAKVSALTAEMEGNLKLRQAELQRIIETAALGGGLGTQGKSRGSDEDLAQALENFKAQLASAETDLGLSDASRSALKKRCTELDASVASLSAELKSLGVEESELNKVLEEEKSSAENMFSQRAMQTQKKADAELKLRELGSLPADFEKYRSLSVKSLLKKLRRTNEGLKAYAHVNKKALDQFVNFTEQREVLRKRREELEGGAVAIRGLISSLDQRKDADILRTFKGVSKYFEEVFQELVPGGRASLVMLKSNSGSGSKKKNQAEGDASSSAARVSYAGVAMKVSFTTSGEAFLLQQLSGGQKSIVALALIFAIQRLDPAPFYLFDEIDANLDASHRQAVANVIRKQAGEKAQFVTTTFRPEFVNAGDKWFGVTHRNKVSSVQEVTQEVARTFINKDETRS